MTRKEIEGALARGYTYPENSHKVLDDKLIIAMADEIMLIDKKCHCKIYEEELDAH